jgi:hypothetical protein
MSPLRDLWGFMVADHVARWFVRGRAPGVDGLLTTSGVAASRSRALLDLLRRVARLASDDRARALGVEFGSTRRRFGFAALWSMRGRS